MRGYVRDHYRDIKGDTRSLDYGSHIFLCAGTHPKPYALDQLTGRLKARCTDGQQKMPNPHFTLQRWVP